MNKKIIAVIVLLLVLVSIPAGVYLVKRRQEIRKEAVTPLTTLSLSPATISKSPREEFGLEVLIDTGENQVAAADVTLEFDEEKLAATNVVQGNFLTQPIVRGDISANTVRFAYYDRPEKQGQGTLATVYFRVQDNASGLAQIRFSSSTQVAGVPIEEGDTERSVLADTQDATVTILALAPTATPTPTEVPGRGGGETEPTPTEEPSMEENESTPTPTPTQVFGEEPTSTPTETETTLTNTPTPTLTSTSTPTPTPTTGVGTGGATLPTPTLTPTPTPEELPVAGVFLPTFSFIALGGLLFVFAFLLF